MKSIYCDGACGKAGDGGWAWVLVENDKLITYEDGHEDGSTNQRCELIPAIKALKYMVWQHPEWDFEFVSDSSYLVNCFKDRWYDKWYENDWRTSSDKEIANSDLWLELLSLWEQHPTNIDWRHVRGHQGDKWNEYADGLAVNARLTNRSGDDKIV